jgi:hypothetical protein
MASWVIVAVSAAAATLATFFLQGGAFPSLEQLPEFALRRWPSLAISWLSVYGAVALMFSSIVAFDIIKSVPLHQSGREWVRAYIGRLTTTQYFSSIVALGAICFAPLASPVEYFSVVVPAAEVPVALIACGALVLLGMLAWVLFSAGVLLRASPRQRDTEESTDIAMIRDLVESFRRRPPATAADLSILADIFAQHRSATEEVKEAVNAVNRLGRTIHDDLKTLASRQSMEPAETGTTTQAAINQSTAELREVMAAFNGLLERVGDFSGSGAAREILALQPVKGGKSQIARSLSQELQGLLEQMPPPKKQ